MAWENEYGGRRWLVKAVREAAGELLGAFRGVDERGLRWRPAEGEWCLKEVAAHLRDAEQLYHRQIELIMHRRNPELPHEALDVLPSERDYRDERLSDLVYEFQAGRDETVWLLRMLDEDDWQRRGIHPYKGSITILDIARDIHEHDLEHLWQARKLLDGLAQRTR